MANAKIPQIVGEWIHIVPRLSRTATRLSDDAAAATARGSTLGDDNSDPQANDTEIYSEPENLPTAISSIMNHAQKRSNFHPASSPPEDLYERYNDYITEVDDTPFFHLEKHDYVKQTFYSKDYNKLIDQVVSLYDSVSAGDQEKIKEDITDMAKSVFGENKSEQWRNLFSQSTIDFSNLSRPRVFIYYTTLYMRHEENGKSEVNEQEYMVHRTEYAVLSDLIHAYANELASLDKTSVDDWLDDSTTPERESAALCFK
ncbi:hypothetical protein L0F51_03345 [Afifella sp. H1R]|uniref:hypothetical protein n=1 Tax=Afifella sp. H1R TaxID=2908841 RepID=UPI001F19FC90|nr:hypothetical protein [Afifella sp. H1R]MCF1502802.1 hypothetical protein [Afifella sp. H1R]